MPALPLPTGHVVGSFPAALERLSQPHMDFVVVRDATCCSALGSLPLVWLADVRNADLRRSVRLGDALADCLDIATTMNPHASHATVTGVAKTLSELCLGYSSVVPRSDRTDALSLRVVVDDFYEPACPNFHTDQVALRALVTLDGQVCVHNQIQNTEQNPNSEHMENFFPR